MITEISFIIRKLSLILILGSVFLLSCSSVSEVTPTIEQMQPTSTLPDPQSSTVKTPDAEVVAENFLGDWNNDQYSEMYELISKTSKNSVTLEEFTQLYTNFANEIALSGISSMITSSQVSPDRATLTTETTYHSSIFPDLSRVIPLELILEDNTWRINWDTSLIMPELAGGNTLKRDAEIIPRGSIYSSNGEPLATQSDAVAVGLWTDYVFTDESEGLLSLLSQISGKRVDSLIEVIENSLPGTYLPIVEVGTEQFTNIVNALSRYAGIEIGRYFSRYYPDGGIAPHAVGYISSIQQEEVDNFRRNGYQTYDKVGREGIEAWGDQYLGGDRGGTLYLVDSEGKIVNQIVETPSGSAEDIYTQIDSTFQQQVQDSLEGLRGAAVVLEKDTGRVLALASSPKFNPNGFQTENINWDSWLGDIYNDPNNPLFNRATQGQYPLGSVFKIITMAAALESGLYDENTTYECGYFFDEAPGLRLNDWTYDWFLEDGETQPSGLLTLPQGLIRSCNPYFWHIGLDLYEQDFKQAISDMARGFGLGSPTGIVGIEEEPGNVSDPGEPVDAINLAIGQGDLLVTPLQVARFVAAIGNGGTLFTPLLVDQVIDQSGNPVLSFDVEKTGNLPVDSENLKIIQDAMEGVVFSRNPQGTAERVFRGFSIPVSGKTGTAETGARDPHAWFVGYSSFEREDKPDIAVVVLVENAGEGSEWAAPIFRRIMEYYFIGTPQRLYPWEAAVGVTKTPTPLFSETPTPEP